jgi:glucosyltransferase GtrII-like protein
MRSLLNTPLEQITADGWARIDAASRKGFFAAVVVSILAFGFEMTNLTLNHDDVNQLDIQSTILGHYLGRFGAGWLYYYTQNHYFMPFLQMAEGILLMGAYGVVVARFWGARNATDVAFVAAILCVFPYMAHTYQYNTSMAINPLAHLLAALAVVFSVRATVRYVALAAVLYVGAFSIYQSVAANAATIFLIWLLNRILFGEAGEGQTPRQMIRAVIAVVAGVVAGGLLYVAIVSMMPIEFDTDHAAAEAFRLGGVTKLSQAIPLVWSGTRGFFVWPESYFPDYLKAIQLVFLAAAGVICLWLPRRSAGKIVAAGLLVLAVFAPRSLQLVHPDGSYHALALTSYAVLVAGTVAIALRAGRTLMRNMAMIVAGLLIAGYVIQCNWISTVNYLNTEAHLNTLTQVLARLRSVPGAHWDGRKVAVVGRYDMPSDYPFKLSTGVANKYIDPEHMNALARILRDEATFAAADQTMPRVLEYAAAHAPWPDPASVAVIDGVGVVVFSNKPAAANP